MRSLVLFDIVARDFARRRVVVREALLEAFDALGEIAHDVGKLAAPTEQDQHDRCDQQKMPNAQAAHETLLLLPVLTRRSSLRGQSRPSIHIRWPLLG